jgi:hypothetical protein
MALVGFRGGYQKGPVASNNFKITIDCFDIDVDIGNSRNVVELATIALLLQVQATEAVRWYQPCRYKYTKRN